MKTMVILFILVLFFSFLKGLNNSRVQTNENPKLLFSEIYKKNLEIEKSKKLNEKVSKIKVSSF